MERHKQPAWILCNPRCGSSYLCELLNNTRKFEPVKKGRPFGEWLKYYESLSDIAPNPPIFNKCTRRQFVALIGEMPREQFESLLPACRYILIHRKDLYAQAVSMYIAKCTDQYHLFSQNARAEYLNQQIDFNEEMILKMYKDACAYPTAWSTFLNGADYLQIYYEDLISDPAATLNKVCRHLDVVLTELEITACVSRHRLLPTTRPETDEFIHRLKQLAGKKVQTASARRQNM
jgi:LPS sulfotransferase NodH